MKVIESLFTILVYLICIISFIAICVACCLVVYHAFQYPELTTTQNILYGIYEKKIGWIMAIWAVSAIFISVRREDNG